MSELQSPSPPPWLTKSHIVDWVTKVIHSCHPRTNFIEEESDVRLQLLRARAVEIDRKAIFIPIRLAPSPFGCCNFSSECCCKYNALRDLLRIINPLAHKCFDTVFYRTGSTINPRTFQPIVFMVVVIIIPNLQSNPNEKFYF